MKKEKISDRINLKLPQDVNDKLRQLSKESQLKMTTIICNGIINEYKNFFKN